VLTKRHDERFFIDRQHGGTRRPRSHGAVFDSRSLRHFATVFELIPKRLPSAWIEAVDRCIAALMA
jgi:hypothetical protein